MTRREWLQQNPRPKSGINLEQLLEQETAKSAEHQSTINQLFSQITVANQAGKTADAAKLTTDLANARSRQGETERTIAQLKAEIAASCKCSLHQRSLHYHRNRPEDLYICEIGPHFLFWTRVDGKAQLVPVANLLLPGLDWPMTDGVTISPEERKAIYPNSAAN